MVYLPSARAFCKDYDKMSLIPGVIFTKEALFEGLEVLSTFNQPHITHNCPRADKEQKAKKQYDKKPPLWYELKFQGLI